jgi:hypothetical protein
MMASIIVAANRRCQPQENTLRLLAAFLFLGSAVMLHTWITQSTDTIRRLPMSASVSDRMRRRVYTVCLAGCILQSLVLPCDWAAATVAYWGLGLQGANVFAETYARLRYRRAVV